MRIYLDGDSRHGGDYAPGHPTDSESTPKSESYRSTGGQLLLVALVVCGAIPVVGLVGLGLMVWLGNH